MGQLTGPDLIAVLSTIARKYGNVPAANELRGEEVESGIVRVVELARGGSSYLMDGDGRVLEYVVPITSHEEALDAFKSGRTSALPDGALAACGFHT